MEGSKPSPAPNARAIWIAELHHDCGIAALYPCCQHHGAEEIQYRGGQSDLSGHGAARRGAGCAGMVDRWGAERAETLALIVRLTGGRGRVIGMGSVTKAQ